MKITNTHVYFWGGIYSNFYECNIEYKDYQFHTSEQLFMWLKAMTFKDEQVAEEILHSSSPKEAKHLGRQVADFDNEVWEKEREDAMFIAVSNKFDQNPQLKAQLLEHKGKTFVEASPYDCIWGVGLREDDLRILDEQKWRGLNLLGKCLTRYVNETETN